MMEDQNMNLYILKEWKRLEINKSHIFTCQNLEDMKTKNKSLAMEKETALQQIDEEKKIGEAVKK